MVLMSWVVRRGLSIVGQSGGVHGINLPCNMREPDDSIAHDAELNEKLDRMVFQCKSQWS